jgi:serine/threonine-protein kinase RsbW
VAEVEIQIALWLPRDAATAALTRHVLAASLDVLGVTAQARDDIVLALSEACANVIQHADDSDEYEIRVRVTGARCVIEVIDHGHGSALLGLGDADAGSEHGRGLRIIRALTENLQIEYQRGDGAVVRFEKALEWAPGSPAQVLTGRDGHPPR